MKLTIAGAAVPLVVGLLLIFVAKGRRMLIVMGGAAA